MGLRFKGYPPASFRGTSTCDAHSRMNLRMRGSYPSSSTPIPSSYTDTCLCAQPQRRRRQTCVNSSIVIRPLSTPSCIAANRTLFKTTSTGSKQQAFVSLFDHIRTHASLDTSKDVACTVRLGPAQDTLKSQPTSSMRSTWNCGSAIGMKASVSSIATCTHVKELETSDGTYKLWSAG